MPPESLDAVILAGGLGTRLRPALPDTPKVLAPVAGRPFLAWLLDRLERAGVRRAILATGYQAERVQQALGPRHGRIEVAYSRETAPLGTGGALRLALPLVASPGVLVLNGDSWVDADLPGFVAWFETNRLEAALLLCQVEDAGRYGQVQLDARGLVRSFAEKRPGGGPGLINAGVYLLAREVVASIPADRPHSLERDLFPALAAAGRLYGLHAPGAFLDIGLPETYAQAEDFFIRLGGGA